MPSRVQAAILGTGNIGTDLMFKLLKHPGHVQLALFAGIDPASDGLARARAGGLATSDRGIEAILADPEIKIVFDATSAKAHLRHAPALAAAGKIAIDLTPAACGPFVVPPSISTRTSASPTSTSSPAATRPQFHSSTPSAA
jgi:acetaldehyde dehydrogenase